MKGIIIRIINQMKNDKRTLALMVIAPLLILTLLYFLLSESSYVPTITVDSSIPSPLLAELQKQDATIIVSDVSNGIGSDSDTSSDTATQTEPAKANDPATGQITAADQSLIDQKTDALLSMDKSGMHIRLLESDSTRISHVTDVLKKAMADLQPASAMEITTVYGSSSDSIFTSLGFVLLGVLAFFFVFIIAGISFVRERETGTLERLMISPIRRISVVGGYTIGYGLFTVLQSVMMITFSYYVLKLDFAGSIPLAILVMVLLSFSAVSSGALVSIFANNEFQVMQFIPIVVIPQIFFSGLLAIDTLPYGLGYLAYIMPVHYGCIALKDIMLKGYGLAEVWPAVTALALINVVLFTLNVLALKKYRQL